MKVRVVKVVHSEKEVLYFPQFFKWYGWTCFHSEGCGWKAVRYETEQEAWDYIKFKQEYPKITYLYEEKNGE